MEIFCLLYLFNKCVISTSFREEKRPPTPVVKCIPGECIAPPPNKKPGRRR